MYMKNKFLLLISIIFCLQLNAKLDKYGYVFHRPVAFDREKRLRATLHTYDLDFSQLVGKTQNFTWKEIDIFAQNIEKNLQQNKSTEDDFKNSIDQAFNVVESLRGIHKNRVEERRATAYHEAAHATAVIFTQLPCVIEKATIKPSEFAAGSVATRCKIDRPQAEKYRNQIIMLLAGGVAEQLLSKSDGNGFLDLLSRPAVRDDIEKSLDAAYKFIRLTITSKEYDEISDPDYYGVNLEATKFGVVESLYPEAVKFVQQHKSTIMNIGDELVEKETLSGFRVCQLAKKV